MGAREIRVEETRTTGRPILPWRTLINRPLPGGGRALGGVGMTTAKEALVDGRLRERGRL